MFTFKIHVIAHWLIIATSACASVAMADYQAIGPAADHSLQSIRTSCSYRFKKRLFSRSYHFLVTSLVNKPAGMETITFSADPFVELRAILSREDLGMLLGDQQEPANWVLQPKRFSDPELRVVFGMSPEQTRAFVSFSIPDADRDYDLPRSVPIDPANLELEQQCIRPIKHSTNQGRR